ncbi:unnamed protein product [Bursaphelenchus okinawaensis]|uniref:Uncharacterized protein n=1 Tax=Bursaphelenchus okinawaensis TaxID=465554 RepID=A0A811KUT1_9BILA|nr:unnamed protein product [Bursaphelenchus okinawaensis]CAG9113618.1 unnamed protein product [Bursaphelenchus okinawaensis]
MAEQAPAPESTPASSAPAEAGAAPEGSAAPPAPASQPASTDAGPSKDKYRVPSRGSHTSRGRSSTARRRPKRVKEPLMYNEWNDIDKDKWKDVTVELRRWKATQRQCQYIRQRAGQWAQLRHKFKSSPLYNMELKVFRQTHDVKFPTDRESYDLPPLN